jgi:hypothetical protein
MAKTRRSSRKIGGGVVTSQQFFNPDVLPPSTIFPAPSSAPTYAEIRPVLSSTFVPAQAGGKTRRSLRSDSRKYKGGFAPSIMGGFVANAQAAIVPLALYAVYHTMVPKVGEIKKNVFGGKSRKNRKHRK